MNTDVAINGQTSPAIQAPRRRLGNRRGHHLRTFSHGGTEYVAGIGFFDDDPSQGIAEIFLNVAGRAGSGIAVAAADVATLASIAFQHHVPVDTIRHALMRNSDNSASGPLAAILDELASDGQHAP